MHKKIHGETEVARYLAGNTVNIGVHLDDFHAHTASYIVTDQTNAVVVEETDIEVFYDDEEVIIVIDGFNNQLADGEKKAMRTIELTCVSEEGRVYTVYESYMLLRAVDLSVPDESLMTAREAQFLIFDTPNVHAFEEAESIEQRKALIEASRRIDMLNFDVNRITNTNAAFRDFNWHVGKLRLRGMDEVTFRGMDAVFLDDLRLAVIHEADDILGGSPVQEARKEGILSESVGESTNMYQVGRPVQSIIGQRAYRILAPYVDRSYRVSR